MWLHVNSPGPIQTINSDHVLLIEGAFVEGGQSIVRARFRSLGPTILTIKTDRWDRCVEFITRLSMYFGKDWVLTNPWGETSCQLFNTNFLHQINVETVVSGQLSSKYAVWGRTKKESFVLQTGTSVECNEWVKQFLHTRGLFI